MLGAPIHTSGVDSALMAKCSQLESVLPRLMKMAAHEAFFLLRSCFAVPRLLYLLRSAPCSSSPGTTRLDDIIKGALTSICNIKLDADSWAQASLPVRWGGIGVRSTVDLAPSAFLSSLHASSPTIQVLLPSWTTQDADPSLLEALTHWSARGGTSAPVGPDRLVQRKWDDGVCSAKADSLLQRADKVNRARLLASVAPGSGSWLSALPSANLGLRLGNQELRIAVGLRVGAPLVRPHRCVCGAEVTRTVTTVSLAVAVLADISAMLWPMTSSSEPSDQWTCMLSWSRHAFCAAMESAPMEPPLILGSTDNILFGTSRVRIRSPRRTSTSPLWRQGQQHPQPSPASGPSMPNCRPRGTTDSLQSRLRHSVRGVLARSKPVRTWGDGLRDIPAMRERPHS